MPSSVSAVSLVITASEKKNADLFWALRGGGGNFGVVTRFEFQLRPVGELHAGLLLYPRSEAERFLRVFARQQGLDQLERDVWGSELEKRGMQVGSTLEYLALKQRNRY